MADVVILTRAGAATPLPAALDRVGATYKLYERLAEAEHALSQDGDAIVVDAGVLDAELLARLRSTQPAKAVVVWLDSPDRTAELLGRGVDDVVHGAMPDEEVAARVVTAGRRGREAPTGVAAYGALRVDAASGEVVWDGTRIRVTRREREVLHTLVAAGGVTVRREQIYRRVWGYAMPRGDRSVDVNITRLRGKLVDATGGRVAIHTEPGVGYRVELPERTARLRERGAGVVTAL